VIRNALRRTASRKLWLVTVAVAGLSTMTAGVALAGTVPGAAPAAGTFNVKTFGAKGDGKANDAAAINKAITAAFDAGGGNVQFPSGTYKVGATIHLKSNVLLQLDAGSTISATGSGYDKAESNANDKYQDYGHSHFNDAVIRGDNVTNVGFIGSGTIDGAGKLVTGDKVGSGKSDKLISITRCDGLTVNGVTLKSGGHFAMITNGCDNIKSDHLTIRTANNRDGWNVISAQHVTITNADIQASDDALGFKSDFALGKHFQNGDVTVTDSKLSSSCCNALMFGSASPRRTAASSPTSTTRTSRCPVPRRPSRSRWGPANAAATSPGSATSRKSTSRTSPVPTPVVRGARRSGASRATRSRTSRSTT